MAEKHRGIRPFRLGSGIQLLRGSLFSIRASTLEKVAFRLSTVYQGSHLMTEAVERVSKKEAVTALHRERIMKASEGSVCALADKLAQSANTPA